MINIGLIGYGYWGPNLARNFNNHPEFHLSAVCDASQDRLTAAGNFYHDAKLTKDPAEVIESRDIDAVAIATPVASHHDLAKRALNAGKHVWLEKPMTAEVGQAEELVDLAGSKDKVLLVDHTFIYTGAVRKIRGLIEDGELGDLIYYDSTRVNLGLFQQDVDVIWDLAPHDISIMDYLMPFKKLSVSATGSYYWGNGVIPKALVTVNMDGNVVAHINVSWVAPVKIRQTLIGGSSKMVVYDDNEPSEKIKVYDKGVEVVETKEELYQLKVQYRVGDMVAPKLEGHEALAFETNHFADCLLRGEKPMTDGRAGLEVVKVLVASTESLKQNGAPVEIA